MGCTIYYNNTQQYKQLITQISCNEILSCRSADTEVTIAVWSLTFRYSYTNNGLKNMTNRSADADTTRSGPILTARVTFTTNHGLSAPSRHDG